MVFPPVLSLPVGGEGTIGKRWSQRKTDTVFLWDCSVSSLCVWKLAGNWATIHPFFFYLYLSSFSNYRQLYPSFSLLLCLFWLPLLLSPLPTSQLHYPQCAVCQTAGWYFTQKYKHWNTLLHADEQKTKMQQATSAIPTFFTVKPAVTLQHHPNGRWQTTVSWCRSDSSFPSPVFIFTQ